MEYICTILKDHHLSYLDELIVSLDSFIYHYSYLLLFQILQMESKLFRTGSISLLCICVLLQYLLTQFLHSGLRQTINSTFVKTWNALPQALHKINAMAQSMGSKFIINLFTWWFCSLSSFLKAEMFRQRLLKNLSAQGTVGERP